MHILKQLFWIATHSHQLSIVSKSYFLASQTRTILRRPTHPLMLPTLPFCTDRELNDDDKEASVEDKVVVILGGEGTGTTAECAHQFLNCGAKGIMFAGANEMEGRELLGELAVTFPSSKSAFLRMSWSDPLMLRNVFESATRHFGQIDIVINHVQFTACSWDELIENSIRGLIGADLLALEFMGKHNRGCGGIIANVVHPFSLEHDLAPVSAGVVQFVNTFHERMAALYYTCTLVKMVTVCYSEDGNYHKQLPNDLLNAIISKGSN